MKNYLRVDWRSLWYSVLIWGLSIVISGFVILPWFYLVFAVVISFLTAYYFRKGERTFRFGLWVALLWFFIILALDLIEVVVFNFADNVLYVSDVRNWLKYVMILLGPVIYCLFAESIVFKKRNLGSFKSASPRIRFDAR